MKVIFAIKIVQKWLSVHFAKAYAAPEHVYGFVGGRSHIDAAMRHIGATWAFSADIRSFFESTPELTVIEALRFLGYGEQSSQLVAKFCCFRGALAQGAPTSPVLSNVCFRVMDESLVQLATKYNCRVTRYADDIVFSGQGEFSPELRGELEERLNLTPWTLAAEKTSLQPIKGRIKIHGLLIGATGVRLTKGYRNQLRGYAHILATRRGDIEDYRKLKGHVDYASHVQRVSGSPTGFSEESARRLQEAEISKRAMSIKRRWPPTSLLDKIRNFLGL